MSVTLWGERAESDGETLNRMLLAGQNPILAVSACRVSSYNGVTVSAGMRSTILIDPDLEEAKALKLWYESEGASATLAPAGEGLATSSKYDVLHLVYFLSSLIQHVVLMNCAGLVPRRSILM